MEVEQPADVLEWKDFVDSLSSGFLPKGEQRYSPFDQTLRFEVGDPRLIPEREPEKRLPHLRKAAGAQITQPLITLEVLTGTFFSSTC